MKAILYSLMVVALVGGMVGGGLFAYFSDTETSVGNTFQAGTIDIVLTELNNGQIVYPDGATDAKPCETALETDTILNNGRNDLVLYKWVEIVGEDPGTHETSPGAPPLSTVTIYDLSYSIDDGQEVVLIADAEGLLLADQAGQWIEICVLPAGSTATIVQSFHIQGDAGNEFQGAVIHLQKAFYGIQVTGAAAPGNPFLP